MENLPSRSDTSIERYRVPITIGVIVVVALVMLFAFVLPSLKQLKSVTHELAETQTAIKTTEDSLSTAEALIKQRYEELANAKRTIFTDEEFYAFYTELLQIVSAARLSLTKLEMSEPKPVATPTAEPEDKTGKDKAFTPAEGSEAKASDKEAEPTKPEFQLVALPAQLTLRSGFFSLYQFIRTLEVYDKLLTVDSISLKPAELAKADVTVTLSVYTMPGAALDAGAAPSALPTASEAAGAMSERSEKTQGSINADRKSVV